MTCFDFEKFILLFLTTHIHFQPIPIYYVGLRRQLGKKWCRGRRADLGAQAAAGKVHLLLPSTAAITFVRFESASCFL